MNLEKIHYKLKNLTLTETIIGINILMFLISTAVDLTGRDGLFTLGSKVNILVAFGEYWRLLTSMFLHADLLHLLFNMMMLHFIGRDIEHIFGKWRFLSIYFVGGLIGSVASYVFTSANSVGASGAIFALLGANLYLFKLNPKVYKSIYGTDLIALIVFNIVLGLVRPNIDMAGHIGGLVGGFFMANALGITHETALALRRLPSQILCFALLAGLFIWGNFTVKQNPENHMAAAYYYNSVGKVEKAERIYINALEQFDIKP